MKCGWDCRAYRGRFSELKFTDQTLARLGANTLFSFSEGTRNLNFRMEQCCCGSERSGWSKNQFVGGDCCDHRNHRDAGDTCVNEEEQEFLLQVYRVGGNRAALFARAAGESTLVKAGQMIIMRRDSKMIPEPVDVDIQKITQSSLLITGFGPLGSEALIAFERTRQNEQKNSGQLIQTNLVIYGAGTNVALTDPNTVDVAVSAQSNAAKSPAPPPTPDQPNTDSNPTPRPTPTPTRAQRR